MARFIRFSDENSYILKILPCTLMQPLRTIIEANELFPNGAFRKHSKMPINRSEKIGFLYNFILIQNKLEFFPQ